MKRIWSFSYVYGSFEIFDETNLLFFIGPNSHLEKCHFRWNRPNRSRIPTKHKDIWQTLWKKRLFGQPKRLISTCFLKLYETARNTVIYGGLPNIEQVHPQIWTRLRSGKWRTREHLTNTRKTTTFLATGAPQDRHIPTVSRFLAKSTRFLSRHSKRVRKLTSAKKSQSSLPSERLCCWDSWIFSAARTKTDFVEKMTEFPHIGKVLLLESLVFVQPPGRQLPFSEKSQSSPTSERLFCWNSWIFSAARTTTDLFGTGSTRWPQLAKTGGRRSLAARRLQYGVLRHSNLPFFEEFALCYSRHPGDMRVRSRVRAALWETLASIGRGTRKINTLAQVFSWQIGLIFACQIGVVTCLSVFQVLLASSVIKEAHRSRFWKKYDFLELNGLQIPPNTFPELGLARM